MKKFILAVIFILFYTSQVSAFAVMNDARIKDAQEYGVMHYQEELPVFGKPWMVYEEKSKALDNFSERAYTYTPYYLVAVNARERLLASQTINLSDGQIMLDGYQNSLPFCLVLFVRDGENLKKNVADNISAALSQNGKIIHPYAVNMQELVVVKTKVIKEVVQPPPITETQKQTPAVTGDSNKNSEDKNKDTDSKKDKKDDKKTKKNADDKKQPQQPVQPVEVKPEPVIIEKTVPDLYRLQVFFYFDMRELDRNAASVLSIDVQNEHERKFYIKFGSLL